MKDFIKSYWKSIIWLCIMFYLLFSPGNALPKAKGINIPHSDKIVHILMFAILTVLYLIDCSKLINYNARVVLFFISVLIFAALSEFIQYAYIPGRSGNYFDLLADAIGLFLGLLIYRLFRDKLHKLNNVIFKGS